MDNFVPSGTVEDVFINHHYHVMIDLVFFQRELHLPATFKSRRSWRKGNIYFFLMYLEIHLKAHLWKWNFLSSFHKFIQDSDDDDGNDEKGDEGDGESQLLTRRIKTQEEKVRQRCHLLDLPEPEVTQVRINVSVSACVGRIRKRQIMWSGWKARQTLRVQRGWRTWWVWQSMFGN